MLPGDASFQVSFDLLDCHIHICTPELVRLFSDNFDYRAIDGRVIHNTLASDILEDRFHFYKIPLSEYVGYINNPKTYGAISQGVLQCAPAPFVLNKVGSRTLSSSNLKFYEVRRRMAKFRNKTWWRRKLPLSAKIAWLEANLWSVSTLGFSNRVSGGTVKSAIMFSLKTQ